MSVFRVLSSAIATRTSSILYCTLLFAPCLVEVDEHQHAYKCIVLQNKNHHHHKRVCLRANRKFNANVCPSAICQSVSEFNIHPFVRRLRQDVFGMHEALVVYEWIKNFKFIGVLSPMFGEENEPRPSGHHSFTRKWPQPMPQQATIPQFKRNDETYE